MDGEAKQYERHTDRGIPRWVKVSALVALLVAAAIVVIVLATGGHTPPEHGDDPAPRTTAEITGPAGHQPPDHG